MPQPVITRPLAAHTPDAGMCAAESRAWLAAIVESSEDAIIRKAIDGTIISWNAGAERIFAYTAQETIGRPIAMLIPEGHRDEGPEILARLQRGEGITHYPTQRVRKDGRLIDVSLSVSPVRDSRGRIVGAVKIARDITEQKRAERALFEAQERLRKYALELDRQVEERTDQLREALHALDAFAYTVAHELRAPLRALRGIGKELREQYGKTLDVVGADYVSRLITAADGMDHLTLELLQLARIATAEITTEILELEPVIGRSFAIFGTDATRLNARLIIQSPLLRVRANGVLLEQILTNLIGNALKFSRPNTPPAINIRTGTVGDRVRIYLQDNGIGIKAGHLKNLFRPFARLVTNDQYPGTGVGLAIVSRAAERMGGKVGVESELGKGSCFWVELPGP